MKCSICKKEGHRCDNKKFHPAEKSTTVPKIEIGNIIKMSVIIASYSTYIRFVVPAKLKLLSIEENDKVKEFGTPYSWYILYGVLHYFDADGKEQELYGDECEVDYKRPDSVVEDEEEGEEEDEGDEDEEEEE